MAVWSGWTAVISILVAASLPLAYRVLLQRRAAPPSPTIQTHVVFGLGAALIAFLHTVISLPALGSPGAVGAGLLPLASAGCAFFLLIAHAGIGLQLRDVRLRDRVRKRRTHQATALAIVVAVSAHVIGLIAAR
jgi:predicted membrane-bound spermidine synthase